MLAKEVLRTDSAPLVRHDFTSPEGIRFTTACFQGPGSEWSLGPLQEPGDTTKYPRLTARLRAAMTHLKAERVYAPSPVEFNGKVIQPVELSRVFDLGKGVLLFRNPTLPADGTFLRADGHAGIFSAGGCGLIVALLDDRFIFAHAGRDCVINRERVLTGKSSRSKESVVDYIVDAFLELGYKEKDLPRLYAWILYSIKPTDFLHRYDHPEHAQYNKHIGLYIEKLGLAAGMKKTSEGIELDIPSLARTQFIQRGVPEDQVSLEHAYLADELPTTRKGGGRYLVAVVRNT